MNCPKCGSLNTIKNGKSPQGKPRIKCHDCGRQSIIGTLPKLTTLRCKVCGKMGVNSRQSMCCINCYMRGVNEYEYKGRIRKTLSIEETTYFRNHLDELPTRLNMTMKQQKYFQENPFEWQREVRKILGYQQ